ncbi:MAG: redox-regulated ATPase YchF [Candidatus Neomarinimicrobiota bacterium]
MSLQCGIVGLPNVGKSTLFSALTHTQVLTDTYPFTTVDPNMGIVTVPDDRLTKMAEILNPEKILPTSIRFVDIAGLIEGSHRGEGLGNQFLAQVREVDAIVHLVRCFTNDKVAHISDTLDATRDIGIVETEIMLKDIETVSHRLENLARKVKVGDKEAAKEKEILDTVSENLNRGLPVRNMVLERKDRETLRDLFLLSAKPMLYVGNENEREATSHHHGRIAEKLRLWASENNERVLILSAALEQELAFLEDEGERQFFMEAWGLTSTGLESLVGGAYDLLSLTTFFTTESNHAQAWTVKQGTLAPQAAGTIHSDFETGFISIETYRCDDLFAHGSESALRENGLIHTHGRDYVIQDDDVVKFKFRS